MPASLAIIKSVRMKKLTLALLVLLLLLPGCDEQSGQAGGKLIIQVPAQAIELARQLFLHCPRGSRIEKSSTLAVTLNDDLCCLWLGCKQGCP